MLKARESLVVHFIRHGQATHNVNAEPLRAAGCSFEAFVEQMRLDDEVGLPQETPNIVYTHACTQTHKYLCMY
jgi:hypothetical protein